MSNRRRTGRPVRREPVLGERYQQIPLPVPMPLTPGGKCYAGPPRPTRKAAPLLGPRSKLAVTLALTGIAIVAGGMILGIRNPLQWASDFATDGMARLQADAGYKVDEILVEGRSQTDVEALRHALNVDRGDSILAFDPEAAREELEKLSWIASARVERMLPDTIYVHLEERKPLALWQSQRKLALIDAGGVVLTDKNLDRFSNLPIVIGAEAPKHAADFLAALATVPNLADRVEAATLVGGRRWDLRLDNGVDVRLPEGALPVAMKRLSDLERSNRLFERDIVAIDLRIPDRTVVQTSSRPPLGLPGKRDYGPGQKI